MGVIVRTRAFSFIDVEEYGAVSYPAGTAYASMTDSATAIQSACDAAATSGDRVVGTGRFRVDSLITIKGDCDFSGAEFVTDDSSAAPSVRAGQTGGTLTRAKVMWLPSVIQNDKPAAPGWNASDIGVECINLYECEVHIGTIQDFRTGLWITSDGSRGNVYNQYIVRHLYNNKRNLLLDPQGATAWVNENTFLLGRLSHNSGEGSNVSGSRHILLGYGTGASANVVNNNRFYGGSIEADTPEYHLECYGIDNYFYHMRWESTTPKAYFNQYDASNYATGNVIHYGYRAGGIVITESTNSFGNMVMNRNRMWLTGSGGADGSIVVDNATGNSSPALTIVPGLTKLSGDPETVFLSAFSGNLWKGKATADTNPRVQIDTQNGRLQFGNGTLAVDAGIARVGADMVGSMTGDKLIATAGLGVGNSATATGPVGTVVKKIEVFDGSGNSLGFIPVYDTIT